MANQAFLRLSEDINLPGATAVNSIALSSRPFWLASENVCLKSHVLKTTLDQYRMAGRLQGELLHW